MRRDGLLEKTSLEPTSWRLDAFNAPTNLSTAFAITRLPLKLVDALSVLALHAIDTCGMSHRQILTRN